MQDPNLGIFPEATRKKDDIETVEPIPSFVARIAGYSGSLILPMAIWGTHKNRNVLGFSDLFVVAGKPIGPFVFEAGYSIALDGRDVDPKNSSLDTLTPNDRAMIVDIRREITEGMQSCLDKAIKLSEQR
jgi:1-acyl-sn-glycerol-3-phosphate acyltransferase